MQHVFVSLYCWVFLVSSLCKPLITKVECFWFSTVESTCLLYLPCQLLPKCVLKDCHEKFNFCTWEKKNFFSVFFTACVQVTSNERWKWQNNLKGGNEWEGFGSDFFSGTGKHSLYVLSSYVVQEPVHLNNNTTSDPFSSNLNHYRAATHSSISSTAQFTFSDSSKLFFLTTILSSSTLPTHISCFCFLLWKP